MESSKKQVIEKFYLFEQTLKEPFIFKKEDYIHKSEDRAKKSLNEWINGEDALANYYRKIEQGKRWPDLLGKTIEVGETQFPQILNIVHKICKVMRISPPRVFIYEDLYYRAETEGIDFSWIELSASLVNEFTENELTFVLASQLARIHAEQIRLEAIARSAVQISEYIEHVPGVNLLNLVYGPEIYRAYLNANFKRWLRISTYSTDACGYLFCGSIQTSIAAMMKLIINEPNLVKELDIIKYINQAKEIESLKETAMVGSKLDEEMPYGPYRILELLRYASSERAKDVRERLEYEVKYYNER